MHLSIYKCNDYLNVLTVCGQRVCQWLTHESSLWSAASLCGCCPRSTWNRWRLRRDRWDYCKHPRGASETGSNQLSQHWGFLLLCVHASVYSCSLCSQCKWCRSRWQDWGSAIASGDNIMLCFKSESFRVNNNANECAHLNIISILVRGSVF